MIFNNCGITESTETSSSCLFRDISDFGQVVTRRKENEAIVFTCQILCMYNNDILYKV